MSELVETKEERRRRLQREATRLRRVSQSPEQKERFREQQRENYRRRRDAQTPEQARESRNSRNEAQRKRRAEETPEQRERRRQKDRERQRSQKARDKARRWAQLNPGRVKDNKRRSYLKHRYGLSQEEYQSMLMAQQGACYLCQSVPNANKLLDVDHCHKTGKVRKLLCNCCNLKLGTLEKDFVLSLKMIHYLIACGSVE